MSLSVDLLQLNDFMVCIFTLFIFSMLYLSIFVFYFKPELSNLS
ncbi:hypothetical protein PROVALCAL_01279 [Providencia alcalifaciens DSM 30120]|uniref:ATP synthase F0 subunit 8 n=1 Tax=Providencia alcalifaciens DSM 30120 TaxID=520999 RepID=B6XD57_9GAMM|nr:hypothetical protein PROVALCAL_01279 [Providencia alcalifaciens DSM 30120]